MGLATDTLIEMQRRHLPNAREVSPKLCAAIGGHLLNLRHKGMRIVEKADGEIDVAADASLPPIFGTRDAVNFRVNFLGLGSKGTGKNIWRPQFFTGPHSMVGGLIPTVTLGSVTDAGLIGSKVPTGRNEWEWERGKLWRDRGAIFFIPEFDVVQKAMKTTHSGNITNTLLEALDGGEVAPTQAGVDDPYETYATFVAWNQPARHEEVSGIDRRFVFHHNREPLGEMVKAYKRAFARHYSFDWAEDAEAISAIRQKWVECVRRVGEVDRIRLADEVNDQMIDSDQVSADGMGMVSKVIMGYWVTEASTLGSDVVVPLTNRIESLIVESGWDRAAATVDPRLLELLKDNEEGKMQLVSTLRAEKIAKSTRGADKLIKSAMKAAKGAGLRYYFVTRETWPNGKWAQIPSGLTAEQMAKRGYKISRVLDGEENELHPREW